MEIVKGVMYDRGTATLGNETKHLTLVAMVVASDEPLMPKKKQEIVVMGSGDFMPAFNHLTKYKPPHKLGNIANAIVDISGMSPDDLDEL